MLQEKRALSGLSRSVDMPVFVLSAGFMAIFVIAALIDLDSLAQWVRSGAHVASATFGGFWQLLMLATFGVAIGIALSGAGHLRLGGTEHELSTFKWVAVIMCTLLAGGGVFWAAAEPIAHFLNMPPHFDEVPRSSEAASAALAQSFMHWGFLAWSILGSLSAITLMHLHYHKGLPLKPRTLLYPVFGERILTGLPGGLVDAFCILAVIAGTVGPIGFLGLQLSYSLAELFGWADSLSLRLTIIGCLMGVYTVSAITGVTRGIQWLSTINVVLGLLLMAYVVGFGPTVFITDQYVQSIGVYLTDFVGMATFRADSAWLESWTIFFWGWFIGYGPMMAIFIARISKGRTIRELILLLSVGAPIVTTVWFTIIGGAGIGFEIENPGSISVAFEGFNLPGALLAITQQLPNGFVVSLLFLVLTTVFVATTGDSMTYSIAMAMTGHEHPSTALRVFWGLMMGIVAMILVTIGAGGISALQSFIVITGVPVSILLLTSLWVAPKMVQEMRAQAARAR